MGLLFGWLYTRTRRVGPLVVAPMLGDGYDAAFLTAGGVLVASAVLAAVARRTAPDRVAAGS